MKNRNQELELARVSSKGQLVIPQVIRKKLKVEAGSIFAITRTDKMLVLKKMESSLSREELGTLKRIEEAWKDIEKGKFKKYSREEFLKKLEKWRSKK